MTEALSQPALPGVRPLTEREFGLFQAFIHREAGIFLAPTKKALLIGRLAKRMRELGVDSFTAYYQAVVDGPPEERVRLFDAICTNETQFFREPQHFHFLETRIYDGWEQAAAAGQRSRRLRVWSVACSTGEEPYSLAMSLLARFPAERGWTVELLATDLSTKALAKAEAGIYPAERIAQVPEALRKQHLLRGVGSQEGKVKIGHEARNAVTFQRMNLKSQAWPAAGRYDLIFCRNVLIYFDHSGKREVVGRLLDFLAPDGLFFLGHSESLHGSGLPVRSVVPTVYRRTQD